MEHSITLGEFIIERQSEYPGATGELPTLFSALRLTAKVVHRQINQAGGDRSLG